MNKILIDAFGGDNAPEEIIYGTLEALEENKNFIAVFVGDQAKIQEVLSGKAYDKERVEILHASEVITCEEEPTVAIRKKPDSSICVAFKELKENEQAKAFVSAGSTGAVLVGATLKLGRLSGINRPALCPIMPAFTVDKDIVLLDAGANADCKSINLVQFALMGSVFAKLNGVSDPKVGLLSNGTEDEKGNALNHEVFPMLKEMKNINFIGNIEARDIVNGVADVVVTDGFSGNIAVKSIEGTALGILTLMKKKVFSTFKGKIGGLFVKNSINSMRNRLDYNKKGGAFFLGVNKLVIKAHGSSKRDAFKASVLQAVTFAEREIVEKIKEQLQQLSQEKVSE